MYTPSKKGRLPHRANDGGRAFLVRGKIHEWLQSVAYHLVVIMQQNFTNRKRMCCYTIDNRTLTASIVGGYAFV
jgi:hypothetical protein